MPDHDDDRDPKRLIQAAKDEVEELVGWEALLIAETKGRIAERLTESVLSDGLHREEAHAARLARSASRRPRALRFSTLAPSQIRPVQGFRGREHPAFLCQRESALPGQPGLGRLGSR